MKKYFILILLYLPCKNFAQQLTGNKWVVDKNIFTIGQDTIKLYDRHSSENIMDFSSFSLLFNSDSTYLSTTVNNEIVSGIWKITNNQLVLDEVNSTNYSLLNNGDLLGSFNRMSGID